MSQTREEPDNPIAFANKAFLTLTGYSAEEILGRNCRFLQGRETSQAAVDEIRRAIYDERELEIEILNYRKDGSIFWNQLGLSPVQDEEGKLLYFFASQIDVTDLRRVQTLEASEHRLLMEVDHRARNVLAVVDSIVRLSRADNAVRYADAIQRRVQVLARAHTLLAAHGWKQVALLDVMQGPLGHLDPKRTTFQGDPVMVSAHIVQPIALAAHELADNAVRHGALSVPNGTLEVAWKARDRDGSFELVWRETGSPLMPVNPHGGFGGAIFLGMVESQLRGRVMREWTPQGLQATIRIPGIPSAAG